MGVNGKRRAEQLFLWEKPGSLRGHAAAASVGEGRLPLRAEAR